MGRSESIIYFQASLGTLVLRFINTITDAPGRGPGLHRCRPRALTRRLFEIRRRIYERQYLVSLWQEMCVGVDRFDSPKRSAWSR